MDSYIVKNSSAPERFNPLKLHQSVVAACLSVRSVEGEAHLVAKRVCQHVLDWLVAKEEVTSADIRRIAANALIAYHPEAAYMYEHHNLIT
ncbi:MAG TPA: ATP cone domain-containing protein [Candidatus Saccharimonadales bacterium]|nr:ATP cone domain-containing protein [Candidatus Saccharimonadales bacterium]